MLCLALIAAAASAAFSYVPVGGATAGASSEAFGFVAAGGSASDGASAAFGYLPAGAEASSVESAAFGYVPSGEVLVSGTSGACAYYPAGYVIASASSAPFEFGETPEDRALREAFEGIGTVIKADDGYSIAITNDHAGTISIPDNLGRVEIDLGGHNLTGPDGSDGTTSSAGGSGGAAIEIVSSGKEGDPTHLVFTDSDPDVDADIVGGDGGKGVPPGNGGPGVLIDSGAQEGVVIEIGKDVTISGGKGGENLAGGAPGEDGKPVEGGTATGEGTVIKAEVPAPTIAAATYNGQLQVAVVAASGRYSVTANAGGTNVGDYDVALTLTDPANCKWSDSDEAAKTLKFSILPRSGVVVTVVGHSETVEFDGQTHTVSGWEFSCADSLYRKSFVVCSVSASVSASSVGRHAMGLSSAAFSNTSANFAGVTFNVTDGALIIEQAATPASVFRYEKIGSDKARILGFAKTGQKIDKIVIPSVIDGRTVTEIAAGAFANSTSGLKEVVLPTSCTTVGDKAFQSVKTLVRLTIPETVPVIIGAYAFAGTALKSLLLPASVVRIGNYAFANCQQLANVTILGKPELGTMPFRRAGTAAGVNGVTVHLDPALAGNAAYIGKVKQDVPSVVVRTDAIVTSVGAAALSVEQNTVRLTVSVGRVAEWGKVDAGAVRVTYRKTLGSAPQTLKPSAVVENADGSLTVEVTRPAGDSGFFQATYEK